MYDNVLISGEASGVEGQALLKKRRGIVIRVMRLFEATSVEIR
jgi:hypothetical protein